MLEHVNLKLGRTMVRHSPVRRLAAHDLMSLLPPPPTEFDSRMGVTNWGMMLNDTLGDCTCAGVAHDLQVASLFAYGDVSKMITAADSQVESLYELACGYEPADPTTDEGGVETDVIAYVEKNGFAGRKLLGAVSPDPNNLDHVKKAIANFGKIYFGANMPLAAQNSGLWKPVNGREGIPGGWGGHAMDSPQYSLVGPGFITWGGDQPADWDWWTEYVDECHVLLWDIQLSKFSNKTQAQILGLMAEIAN